MKQMKQFVAATLTLLSASVFAANLSPNEYACTGDGSQVDYSTTSLSGQPLFNLDGRNFMGRQIRSEKSSLGKLVSVQTGYVPDLAVSTSTLLVPDINLKNASDSVEFDSILIDTTGRTSFGGPAFVKGALQSYKIKPVHCVARQVMS